MTYAPEILTGKEYKNSDGTPAPLIAFAKQVNGTQYVVVAVPDSAKQQLEIVTAYKSKSANKNGTPQVSDAPSGFNAPDVTSKTDPATVPFDQNIAQNGEKVNRQEQIAKAIEVGKNTEILGRGGNALQQGARTLYQTFVSAQEPLEAIGKYQAKQGSTATANDITQLTRQAGGTTDYILADALVDMSGNELGQSFKSVIDAIPTKDRADFNTYAQNLHNIDRWAQDKPVYSELSPKQSENIVQRLEAKHPEFKQYSQTIAEWWNTFGQEWMVKSGLMSQDAFDAMREMYPNYVPVYRKGKNKRGNINRSGSPGSPAQGGDFTSNAVTPIDI